MSILSLGSKFDLTACSALVSEAQKFECKKQRRHEFWILTCYMSLPIIKQTIKELKKHIKITDCYFSFNFSEIFKSGPGVTQSSLAEIEKWCKKKGINFEWKALISSSLIHSKGYAVIQRKPTTGKIMGGAALVTSANFSNSGFCGTNIELGYLTTRSKDISTFEKCYDHLWETFGTSNLKKLTGHLKNKDYLLKYSILASGVFLHKWSGSLKQLSGIKYSLTDDAKKRASIAPELKEYGFESGDTFTRQVLPFTELPPKEIPRQFIKSFTIETYWGRWCPKEAWETIGQYFHGADPFIVAFKKATTTEKLDKTTRDAKKTQKELIKLGLIKKVPSNHIERWRGKINSLRKNKRRLKRFFIGYEAIGLPYRFNDKTQVTELFENLIETIDLSGKQYNAMGKVNASLNAGNLNAFNLTKKDFYQIEKMMRG